VKLISFHYTPEEQKMMNEAKQYFGVTNWLMPDVHGIIMKQKLSSNNN
jgi:hypothetical protein